MKKPLIAGLLAAALLLGCFDLGGQKASLKIPVPPQASQRALSNGMPFDTVRIYLNQYGSSSWLDWDAPWIDFSLNSAQPGDYFLLEGLTPGDEYSLEATLGTKTIDPVTSKVSFVVAGHARSPYHFSLYSGEETLVPMTLIDTPMVDQPGVVSVASRDDGNLYVLGAAGVTGSNFNPSLTQIDLTSLPAGETAWSLNSYLSYTSGMSGTTELVVGGENGLFVVSSANALIGTAITDGSTVVHGKKVFGLSYSTDGVGSVSREGFIFTSPGKIGGAMGDYANINTSTGNVTNSGYDWFDLQNSLGTTDWANVMGLTYSATPDWINSMADSYTHTYFATEAGTYWVRKRPTPNVTDTWGTLSAATVPFTAADFTWNWTDTNFRTNGVSVDNYFSDTIRTVKKVKTATKDWLIAGSDTVTHLSAVIPDNTSDPLQVDYLGFPDGSNPYWADTASFNYYEGAYGAVTGLSAWSSGLDEAIYLAQTVTDYASGLASNIRVVKLNMSGTPTVGVVAYINQGQLPGPVIKTEMGVTGGKVGLYIVTEQGTVLYDVDLATVTPTNVRGVSAPRKLEVAGQVSGPKLTQAVKAKGAKVKAGASKTSNQWVVPGH